MSGFFGIFRPQGGPVDIEAFDQMKTAMHRDGFDGMETHVEEKIAMGHLMLRVSPESKYDKQPLKSSCGNYILVGHFRLDYRDELGDKLGLTQSELDLTPDSQLAMFAYQKWKEKCVHQLEGDWAFVVFNPTTESIFIAKDPFGYSAIFYRMTSDQFYFSTLTDSLSSISSLTNKINLKQFFRQSVANVGPSISETLIENLYSVECGTYTLWDKSMTEKKFKYFSLQTLHSIRYRDDLDYSFSLSSIFSLAVKSKIRDCKSVGIFLSGGLDSTGVAHFASNELANQGKTLYSFTSFPYYLDEISEKQLAFANEVPLVQKFVQVHKNIEPNFYNFPEARLSNLLLSEYTKDAFTPIVNSNIFWIEGILSEIKNKKITIVLNGQLGNYTLTPSASFIHSEMFISFKFISLFKDLWTISQKKSQPVLQTFRNRVLGPLKFQILSFKKYYLFNFSNYYIPKSILNKKPIGLECLKFKNEYEIVPFYSFITSSRKLRKIQLSTISTNAGKLWYREAEKKGIQISDPTSDHRLIHYSFAIPEKEYNKWGVHKAVFRNMMKGRIPNELLDNVNKMVQSFDIDFRFKSDAGIKLILDQILSNSCQIPFIKVEELGNLYKEIMESNSVFSSYSKILQFLNNLSLILFYLRINNLILLQNIKNASFKSFHLGET